MGPSAPPRLTPYPAATWGAQGDRESPGVREKVSEPKAGRCGPVDPTFHLQHILGLQCPGEATVLPSSSHALGASISSSSPRPHPGKWAAGYYGMSAQAALQGGGGHRGMSPVGGYYGMASIVEGVGAEET